MQVELFYIQYTHRIEGLYELLEAKNMERYICIICGYIYDPALGDPQNGVEPGTSFKDLPEGWLCQLCGAYVDEFVLAE